MSQNDYCVYCHTTPSGRRYVGISSFPEKRWRHGRGYEKNYLFSRAIEKYGWDNILHEILHDGLSLKEAKAIEKKLIAEWNLTDHQYGMNLSGGGDGILADSTREMMSNSRKGNNNCKGRILSQETKNAISASLKEYYKVHPNPMRGKHLSEEAKQKLRARVFSEETKARMRENSRRRYGKDNPASRPMRQYSLDGTLLNEYESGTQACKKYGLDLSAVVRCCRGKRKTCGGYIWKYAD